MEDLRDYLKTLPGDLEVAVEAVRGSAEYPPTPVYILLEYDERKVMDLDEFRLKHPPGGIPSPNDPVDLHKLMSGEPPEQEWLVEPILPRGKLVGFVSRRGEGKSLFALDVATNRAAGQPTLHQSHDKPCHVVYLDMEMGPEDLFDRLFSLGWTTAHPQFDLLAEHLHYYQLIAMPPLNTQEGGEALEALVDAHDAAFVVIDTVSRVIAGEENAAEPFRDLFRYTETRLKRRGVTLARLDHLGKDADRGSRGSSAKEDPLDVVWHVSQTGVGDETLTLKLTKGRQDWVPRNVTIKRDNDNGVLRHRIPEEFAPDWLLDLVDTIDGLGLPEDAGYPTVSTALQEAGEGRRATAVRQAIRFRKGRSQGGPKTGPDPGPPPADHLRDHPGPPDAETQPDLGLSNGTTPRTTPDQGKVVHLPPRKGTTPQPNDLPDPY